jgi:hypothetical protein
VDEGLDVAAVDDTAVLGGQLAEAGHDVGGQLGQADLAEYPDGGQLRMAPGPAEGQQQVFGERRERNAAMVCRVDAQQGFDRRRACILGVQERHDRRDERPGRGPDGRCRRGGARGPGTGPSRVRVQFPGDGLDRGCWIAGVVPQGDGELEAGCAVRPGLAGDRL